MIPWSAPAPATSVTFQGITLRGAHTPWIKHQTWERALLPPRRRSPLQSGRCGLLPWRILHQRWCSHLRGVCSLPPLLRRVHPWGGAYSPWVPFCPCRQWEEGFSCWLPWTGTVAQLRPGLGSPRHPFHPDNSAPGLQQQLGPPLFPLPGLRHSRDWVRPHLRDSNSTPPLPPRSPPQCPQLFRVPVGAWPINSHVHPSAPRPRSSLTAHLYKVNRWEGRPQNRVRPHPMAPRERVRAYLRPGWPPPSIRSLFLPGSSLQLPGVVRSPKWVSAPWLARFRLRRLAGPPFPIMETPKGSWIPCIGIRISWKKRDPSLRIILP